MSITLRQLEILHGIVVAGSMGDAARILGLAQPTLSQQLAKLETTLDAQLISRDRSQKLALTPAGEHWFRTAERLLGTLQRAQHYHDATFSAHQLMLQFGTTPSLRGRFVEMVARTAVEIDSFARFEFAWAANSDEIADLLAMRRINCAIVAAASVAQQSGDLDIEPLCRDALIWAVPAEVPENTIARVLEAREPQAGDHPALTRYVSITSAVSWEPRSRAWYRQSLPGAVPYFACVAHHPAIDIVAAGLATCHVPVSLLPNLPDTVQSRIKFYDIGLHARDIVLAMPRHLLSLRPFAEFRQRVARDVRAIYGDALASPVVRLLPLVPARSLAKSAE